ncbi:MAG TPA: Zeta toxin family protein [Cyanobacteria bacterium UBA11369]|nr:Zeta toxin family protein [Cyanobacteria bacterium UBA11371]HBE32762.1 Zeta toxin family protein [Cyanobacteria bacterium UBA11368]HBE49736.1 Zeta toxin family protein [Cyanobacteria bacterium UBA11369]
MVEEQAHLIVIAPSNGAGKSTAAPALLQATLGVTEFVNADAIALGLSGFAPERAAFRAGRIMIERLQQLANERVNFAFETTLATRSFAPWIANLRQTGYLFHLFFLWLPSPELAIARVQERVRLGGHDVPEETIRRRYHAGIRNFFHLYRPLADSWFFYDNANTEAPHLLAASEGESGVYVANPLIWQLIEEEYRGR